MPVNSMRSLAMLMGLVVCGEQQLFAEENWVPLGAVATLSADELPAPEPPPGNEIELRIDRDPIAIDLSDAENAGEESRNRFPGRAYNDAGWYSRPRWDGMTWRSGTGNRFGDFSVAAVGARPVLGWDGLSLTSGYGVHFLAGPSVTDMPPRVFDLHAGLHWFGEVAEHWWLDLGFSGGLYTDFEDSVREGWRFPAHAVATWEWSPEIQPVAGVRYFDRENLGLLPVAGLIYRPEERIRLELLFPEPRVAWRIASSEAADHWLSISGRIGGGEWAIERSASGLADVANYNDYQLVLSLDTIDNQYAISSFEIGYAFERELVYRSGAGNTSLPETLFIRLVHRQ
jgi:hypothetical protein